MIAIWRAFIRRRLRQKWIFYTSSVTAVQSRKPRTTWKLGTSRRPGTTNCLHCSKKKIIIIIKTPSTIASTLAVASFKDHMKLSARLSHSKSDKGLISTWAKQPGSPWVEDMMLSVAERMAQLHRCIQLRRVEICVLKWGWAIWP